MVKQLSEAITSRIVRLSRTTSAESIAASLGVSRASVFRVLARKEISKTTSEELKRVIPRVIHRLRMTKGRKRVSAREISIKLPGVSVRTISRIVKELDLNLARVRKRVKNEALDNEGLKRLCWFACRTGWG